MLLLCGKHDDETQARRRIARYVRCLPIAPPIAFVMWPRPLPLWHIAHRTPIHPPTFPPAVAVYNKTFIASCHAQACPSSRVRCDCLLLSFRPVPLSPRSPSQIPIPTAPALDPLLAAAITWKYNAYATLSEEFHKKNANFDLPNAQKLKENLYTEVDTQKLRTKS